MPPVTENEVEQQRAQVKEYAAANQKLAGQASAHEATLAVLTSTEQELIEALAMRIEADVETLAEQERVTLEQLQRAENAGIEIDAIRKRLTIAHEREILLVQKLAEAQAALVSSTGSLQAAEQILREREAAVPEALRAKDALTKAATQAAA